MKTQEIKEEIEIIRKRLESLAGEEENGLREVIGLLRNTPAGKERKREAIINYNNFIQGVNKSYMTICEKFEIPYTEIKKLMEFD